MICPECGHDSDEGRRWTRGPLTAILAPPAVYHKGVLLKLAPMQAKMLGYLVRRGQASYAALGMMFAREDTISKSVQVQMHYVRRQLPDDVQVETIHGWGYRLVT